MVTKRENFITALKGNLPVGRVPHFELVFYLTMEAFGKLHPTNRNYSQWVQMSEAEKNLHREDIVNLYLETARRYDHSAIFFHKPSGWDAEESVYETIKCLELIRKYSGDEYFLMIHGDATYSVPSGDEMVQFSNDIYDSPQKIKDNALEKVEKCLKIAEIYKRSGVLDGFALCSDYCLNQGPFLSPAMFDDFITPFLKSLIKGYRDLGFYTIKHTDGNIMPIIDSLIEANPHALHSLDPQGGIDIAEIKNKYGKNVCLIGNVNCGLMDVGTDQQVKDSARYALKYGMPGGGYIFSTSNCIYTGMRLERYEMIHKIWREEGIYE